MARENQPKVRAVSNSHKSMNTSLVSSPKFHRLLLVSALGGWLQACSSPWLQQESSANIPINQPSKALAREDAVEPPKAPEPKVVKQVDDSVNQAAGEAVAEVAIVLPSLAPAMQAMRPAPSAAKSSSSEQVLPTQKNVIAKAKEAPRDEVLIASPTLSITPKAAPVMEERIERAIASATPAVSRSAKATSSPAAPTKGSATVRTVEPPVVQEVVSISELEKLPATAAGIKAVDVITDSTTPRPSLVPAGSVIAEFGMWELQKTEGSGNSTSCRLSSSTIQIPGTDFTSQVWFSVEKNRFVVNSSAPLSAKTPGVGIKLDKEGLMSFSRSLDADSASIEENLLDKLASARKLELFLKLGPESETITRTEVNLEALNKAALALKKCN
ncbi:MAG: hypothetical protein H6999_11565 [Hahellaceae bacterium]|nr:hypothetical protein [Hahellaceae bacterium]